MSEFGQRIKERREALGLTLSDVARRVNVAEATVQRYESGSIKNPGHARIVALADVLGVDANFLMGWTSDGEETLPDGAFNKTKSASVFWFRPLAEAYAAAPLLTQQNVCKLLDIQHVAPDDTVESHVRVMPVYVFPAAAGIPLYAEDAFEDIEFPEDQVPKGTDFGIRIRGDSMQPTIEDDTIVWVKKQTELHNGQIGIFMLHDEAVCKRFHEDKNGIRLVSDNEAYPPIEVKDYDAFRIVGRVLR